MGERSSNCTNWFSANQGIGYATSVLLASRGCRIIIACRRDARKVADKIVDLTGNPNIVTKYLDLSKFRTVHAFARDIAKSEPKIDILVNNAGILCTSDNGTEDGLNTVMQVNYFGHFLLTHLLVDQLKASGLGNVVFLSSFTTCFQSLKYLNYGDCSRKTLNHFTNYANSKLLNVLASQEFGKRLKKYGILVNCADPGVTKTTIFDTSDQSFTYGEVLHMNLLMKAGILLHAKDLFEAAQTIFHLAASRDLQSGGHYCDCKPFIKARFLDDRTFCEKVWQKSEELVKLKHGQKIC